MNGNAWPNGQDPPAYRGVNFSLMSIRQFIAYAVSESIRSIKKLIMVWRSRILERGTTQSLMLQVLHWWVNQRILTVKIFFEGGFLGIGLIFR